MKKTLTINISGSVFHIDEDAYDKLHGYLSEINRHFRNDADSKEIIDDIEARISELFRERIKGANEVVNISHVDEVIGIMGSPEAIIDSDEPQPETNSEEPHRRTRARGKKLYRDPDDRVLGGVCSGLGAYFSVDPLIFRLLFVLIFFFPIGSSVLIYLILWIVVPRAKNTAQRLEMKGEEVNVSNISKSIKEEFQDVKENYKRFRSSNAYVKGEERVQEIGGLLGQILRVLLKIIVVVLGIILVVLGITAVLGLFGSLFFTHEFLGLSPWSIGVPNYLDLFVDSKLLSWFWIGLTIVIGIPLIMLVYIGAKLVFHFKSNNTIVGTSAIVVWIIGIIFLIFTAGKGLSNYKSASNATTQEAIKTASDTLYIKLGDDEFKDYIDTDLDFDNFRIASLNGKKFLLGAPMFDIEKTDAKEFSLVIRNRARGRDLDNAQQSAREIKYKFTLKDSLLTCQPWFMIPEESTWRNQEVNITLKVPENKSVYLNDNLIKIIHDIENSSNTWDGDMVGKYWTMKPEGLTLVNRAVPSETSKSNKK